MSSSAALPRAKGMFNPAGFPRALLHVGLYLGVFIAAWWAYAVVGKVPTFLLPTPDKIWEAFVSMSASGILWVNLAGTVQSVAFGFVVGVVIGIAMGYLVSRFQLFREITAPYIILSQAAPKIAIVPLLVLWLGLGLGTQLALTLLLTFFPVMVAAQLGFASMSNEARDLGAILGFSRIRSFWTIQLPGALPDLFAGAKIGILEAVEGAFLAEFLTAQHGLGYLMVLGGSTYNAPMLFGAVILTVLVGLTGFGLIFLAERYFLRWRKTI